MTNYGLVEWVKSKLGQGYVYAAYFDRLITEAYLQQKAKQFPNQYSASYLQRSRKWLGRYAGDCVGLIKAYYWQDGDRIVYRHNNRADVSANGMHNLATVKGAISTMPDVPGLYVHFDGHIGVYIGGGEVVEARGVDYGVVKTKLKDRPWRNWGQVPYVEYGGTMLKKGDKGEAVGKWQSRLLEWNSSALPVYKADKSFGGETTTWTNNFKKVVGLPQDGQVDDLTWDAMVGKLKGVDQSQITALNAKVKAAENAKLVAENKLAQARQARSTLLNF